MKLHVVSLLMIAIRMSTGASDISFIKSKYKVNNSERRSPDGNDNEYNFVEFTNYTFHHAEGPVWDAERQTLYCVDVLGNDVHAFQYQKKGGMLDMKHRVRHIDYGEVNIVHPIRGSHKLLVAVEKSLYVLDWDVPGNEGLKHVSTFDLGYPENILNEGKPDPMGRFWGGSKGPQDGHSVKMDYATFCSCEAPFFEPQIQLKPVSISNGLVWSLNNSVLYYVDSGTRKIEAFDFDLVRGRISNRRTVIDLEDYDIEPHVIADGMTIDKDGFLWIALNFGGAVIRVDPDQSGTVVTTFKLPTAQPTSLVWGGPNMDWLFVTTSRRHMDAAQIAADPLAGSVFVLHNTTTSGVQSFKVIRVDPDQSGTVVTTFKLPTAQPTSLVWGGPNMDWLFVTTSRRHMDAAQIAADPLAGSVFVLHNTTTSGVQSFKVIRVDPDQSGTVVTTFKLPTAQPTSLVWGGPNMDWLFVTTSRRHMDAAQIAADPLAGSVFVLHNTTTSGVQSFKVNFPDVDTY